MDDRCNRPAHGGGVNDQYHGCTEKAGDRRRGPVASGLTAPVEQAHDPFRNEDVGPLGASGGERGQELLARQPRIEGAPGATGGDRVVSGVDEVGSDLRRRHSESPGGKSGHQAGGDRRLAHSGVGARDDDAGAKDWHGLILPRARGRSVWSWVSLDRLARRRAETLPSPRCADASTLLRPRCLSARSPLGQSEPLLFRPARHMTTAGKAFHWLISRCRG